jgi:hypothetical protein
VDSQTSRHVNSQYRYPWLLLLKDILKRSRRSLPGLPFLFSFYHLVVLTWRRLVSQPVLSLLSLAGVVLAVALLASSSFFGKATNRVILTAELAAPFYPAAAAGRSAPLPMPPRIPMIEQRAVVQHALAFATIMILVDVRLRHSGWGIRGEC